MNRFCFMIVAFGLFGCVNPSRLVSAGPVVVAEVQPDERLASAPLKQGIFISDQSCDSDPHYDQACAPDALPVYTLPSCGEGARAALPVISLPIDLNPYDCEVRIDSWGVVAFSYDPAWRLKCSIGADARNICMGVQADACLGGLQQVDSPLGGQGELVLSCTGYAEVKKTLVLSAQAPKSQFFPSPNCTQ